MIFVVDSCELWTVGQEFFYLFDIPMLSLYTVFAYIGEFRKKEWLFDQTFEFACSQ